MSLISNIVQTMALCFGFIYAFSRGLLHFIAASLLIFGAQIVSIWSE